MSTYVLVVTSPANHHQTGGEEGLAGHARHGVALQEGVEDGVGDLVGHLVGMALGDRLGGECRCILRLGGLSSWADKRADTLSKTASATALWW